MPLLSLARRLLMVAGVATAAHGIAVASDARIEEAAQAYGAGQFQLAFDIAQEVLRAEGGAAASSDNAAEAATICSVAAGRVGNSAFQISCARIAEKIRRASPNNIKHAISLSNLGAALSLAGRLDEALPLLRRGLQILEPHTKSGPQASQVQERYIGLLTNLASAERQNGTFLEAERRYEEARDRSRAAFGPDSLPEAITLNNLGEMYSAWPARRERAESTLLEALRIRQLRRDGDRGHTHTNLGTLYYQEYRNEESRYHHSQAYLLWRDRLRASGAGIASNFLARSTFNLGRIAEVFEDRSEAVQRYSEAVRLRPPGTDPLELGTGYRFLVKALLAERLVPDASRQLESYAKAIDLPTRVDSLVAGYYWLTAGQVSRAQRQFADAEQQVARAIQVAQRSGPEGLKLREQARSERAELLIALGRSKDLVAMRREDLRVVKNPAGWEAITATHNLAWTLWLDALAGPKASTASQVAEAHGLSERAVTAAGRLIASHIPFACSDLNSEIGFDVRTVFALNVLINLAVAATDQPSVASTTSANVGASFKSLQLLDAYDGSWAARGEVRRAMNLPADVAAWDMAIKLSQQHCALSRLAVDSASASDTSEQIASIDLRLIGALSRLSGDLQKIVTNSSQMFTLAEVAAALSSDEALVSYFVTGDASFAIVVRQKTVSFRKIDLTKAALAEALGALRAALVPPVQGRPMRPFDLSLARSLYARLISPIQDTAGEALRTLYILPDPAMSNVPWMALSAGPGRAGSASDPSSSPGERWLLDELSLSVLPSVRSFMVMRKRQGPVAHPTLSAFSDPTTDPRLALKALPSSSREAAAVAAAFPAGRSQVWTGAQATETNLRKSRASVVLISAHGLTGRSDHAGGDPFLALAPEADQKTDGLLTSTELAAMDLSHIELAILSACDTGTVTNPRLGAFGGLVQGFLAGGARGVVATQWPLDSAAAADLIGAFADARWRSGLGVNESLRRAAMAVRAKPSWSHPYYWAPLVHVGVQPPPAQASRGQAPEPQ